MVKSSDLSVVYITNISVCTSLPIVRIDVFKHFKKHFSLKIDQLFYSKACWDICSCEFLLAVQLWLHSYLHDVCECVFVLGHWDTLISPWQGRVQCSAQSDWKREDCWVIAAVLIPSTRHKEQGRETTLLLTDKHYRHCCFRAGDSTLLFTLQSPLFQCTKHMKDMQAQRDTS